MSNSTAVVQRLYESMAQGDMAALRSTLADGVTFAYEDPAESPLRGPIVGIDGVMGFFGAICEHGEMLAFGIDRFVDGGGTVVVLGHEQVQFKAAGASYQTRWAHVHEVRDGKIARIHAGDARCLS